MRVLPTVSTAVMLLGCSRPEDPPHVFDVNAAAAQAEGDIANYAAARRGGGRAHRVADRRFR